MYEGAITLALFLFVCCMMIFSAANGNFSEWNGADLANFGTFVGGTLGFFALVAAFMQFLASTRAQRDSNRIALDERHRTDLRIEISKVEERLERLLNEYKLPQDGQADEVSLSTLLNGPLWVLNKEKFPNYKSLEAAWLSKSQESFRGEQVLLFHQLSTISLKLNDLFELVDHFDKVSKSNLMSISVGRTYFRVVSALEELQYPIKKLLKI